MNLSRYWKRNVRFSFLAFAFLFVRPLQRLPHRCFFCFDTHTCLCLFVCFFIAAESALKSFLAGGVGGVCVVLVGHPLDLIKVRMQTAGAGGSKNVLGMLSQTLAKEGIRGIYRGASAPLVSISFIFAVCFCT